MHREIQIKQFPIVTTHWWPKTRNERFVWENQQYLYRFLPLVHNHVQVIWVHTSGVTCVCVTCVWVCVCDVCAHALLVGVNAWRRACLKRGADATFQAPTEASANQIASCKYPIPVHATPEKYVSGCCNYDGVSAPRFRHALRQRDADAREAAWAERAHTHVTHRMCVHTHFTWTWLCTRGKKRYKYCSFSHTNRSFRVLGHQCVVTMGNCLIWISLCMFFFPLIETVTYTCHYMTDRLERFDLKTSKLDLLKKKRHLHLGCPWGKLIDTTF